MKMAIPAFIEEWIANCPLLAPPPVAPVSAFWGSLPVRGRFERAAQGRSYPFGTALRNNRYLRICRRRVSGPRRFVGFDSFHEIVERTDRGSRRDQRISKGGRWIAGTTRLPALTQNARGSNLSPHSQISCGFTYGERDRSEKPPALIGRGFRFAETLRKYASWV